MFSWLVGCRPHSSPDPFGATLPPGEGMELRIILLILPIPGIIRQTIHGGDDREHDGEAQQEVGGQDVQHRGGGLGARHVQVIRAVDHPVDAVGDDDHHQQSNVGLDRGLHRGTHAVDEDHVENGDVAQGVLRPELVIAEPGGAGEIQGRGGQQGKE